MEKKNAFVTGGSSGIGKAICLMIAKREYNVIFSHFDSDDEKANNTLKQIKQLGVESNYIKANIADKNDRPAMLDFIKLKFEKLDLLVNNAGIAPLQRADILEATEESFDLVVSVNLKGPYFLTQQIAKFMIETIKKYNESKPMIINISSISSYASSTSRGEYCISKAGVSMMTKLYADRLSEYGINVYEISPGIILTPMTEKVKDKYDDLIFSKNILLQRRWGYPEDIAKVVDSIVNGNFIYSTGQVFLVDGGFQVRRL